MTRPVRDKNWYYTYILESQTDGNWYTGCTTDLQKRVSEHNSGEVTSTKGREPFKIIYCEVCKSRKDAYARERYLKSGMGKRYIKNRLKNYFDDEDDK